MWFKDTGRRGKDLVYLEWEILISTVTTLGSRISFPSSPSHILYLFFSLVSPFFALVLLYWFVNLSFFICHYFLVTEKDPSLTSFAALSSPLFLNIYHSLYPFSPSGILSSSWSFHLLQYLPLFHSRIIPILTPLSQCEAQTSRKTVLVSKTARF